MNESFLAIRRSFFAFPLVVVCLVIMTSQAAAQNADLSVVKSGPGTSAAGTDITYDIGVSNFSGQDSTPNNVLTDTLPSQVTFVSETHSPDWSCITPAVGSTGTITCTNTNPLPDEYGAAFSFVVHIASDVGNNTVLSNTAHIQHQGNDSNTNNNDSTWNTTIGEPPPPPPPPLAPHDVLINEFRLAGPGGSSDEYVELYCNRDVDCDVSGASIRSYNLAVPVPDQPTGPADLSYTFPAQTIIPARQRLLVGDATQFSLPDYGTLDFNVHNASIPDYFNDNQGLQVISAGDPIVIDSVGFIGGGDSDQFIEGTGLQRATGPRPADQYAYVRKRPTPSGLPQDTDNNANDFVLVSVTGTAHPGITALPVLGAPGPRGLRNPLSYDDSQVTWSYVEPAVDAHLSPNRVRCEACTSPAAPYGTISFRRSFTNNTNQTFNYIAFRVVQITTLNSPNTLGDQAELRLITPSGSVAPFENSQARTVTIQNPALEYDSLCPDCQPQQPNGGGLNSTVSLVETTINPGQTIDVQFLANVVHTGTYRLYVYVEAFPQLTVEKMAPAKSGRVRVDAQTYTPRNLVNLRSSPKAIATQKTKTPSALPARVASVGSTTPSVTSSANPVRILILNRPDAPTDRPRKKKRLRRKASAALRAKAEARLKNEQPQN